MDLKFLHSGDVSAEMEFHPVIQILKAFILQVSAAYIDNINSPNFADFVIKLIHIQFKFGHK